MPTVSEAGDYYKAHDTSWIETFTGKKFSLDKPEFCKEDIAHALSQLCRYNGHCSEFYSVAEHSLLVSALVWHMGGNKQQCLEGLLHDATEAYLSDVPAPFKQLLPDWKAIDVALEFKLREWAGLPSSKTGYVKEADWIALYIEAYQLLPDQGACFIGPEDLKNRGLKLAQTNNIPLLLAPPGDLVDMFLQVWHDLEEGDGYDGYGVKRVRV